MGQSSPSPCPATSSTVASPWRRRWAGPTSIPHWSSASRCGPHSCATTPRPLALGEWVLRGRSDPRLVFIGVGSGIGGAVVDEGVVTHCNLFGHQPGFGSRRCSCGRSGCLETVAAGWAMPRPLDGAAIESAARAIATALAAEPAAARGLVVVGGGVAAHYPQLIDRIGAALPGRRDRRQHTPARGQVGCGMGNARTTRRRSRRCCVADPNEGVSQCQFGHRSSARPHRATVRPATRGG